jgi:hypothetical protein
MISFYHINQTNHAKITVQTFNLNLLGFENLTGLTTVIAGLTRNPLSIFSFINIMRTIKSTLICCAVSLWSLTAAAQSYDYLWVNKTDGSAKSFVLDLAGRTVGALRATPLQTATINVSHLPAGVYIVKTADSVKKITINN